MLDGLFRFCFFFFLESVSDAEASCAAGTFGLKAGIYPERIRAVSWGLKGQGGASSLGTWPELPNRAGTDGFGVRCCGREDLSAVRDGV
jgi:hypothetical protein